MILHSEELKGRGTPLIMLHGWGQSLEAMRPLGKILSRGSHPHLIDLPGFGLSEVPSADWDCGDYADSIKHYMDERGIEKADFLGHSFGGKVAISFALRYPNRLCRLVLAASAGLKGRATVKKRVIRFAAKLVKAINRSFYESYFVSRYGSRDYLAAQGPLRQILVRSVNEDLSKEITALRCPTLLLWGARDKETPPEMGARMNSLIPGSRLILFSQHGHDLYLGGGSHLLATKILPFLENDD